MHIKCTHLFAELLPYEETNWEEDANILLEKCQPLWPVHGPWGNLYLALPGREVRYKRPWFGAVGLLLKLFFGG